MLADKCGYCKNLNECNTRFVNAVKGDKIYCPDGSVLVVNVNYQKPLNVHKVKTMNLHIQFCDKCRMIMKKIPLEKEEFKRKIQQLESKEYSDRFSIFMIKINYDYYECPKCGFFKFHKVD
jgi:hypothetical protein